MMRFLLVRCYCSAKGKKVLSSWTKRATLNKKQFISHLISESDKKWLTQCTEATQYVGVHPTGKYSISVVSEKKVNVDKSVYILSLKPISNWLIHQNGQITELANSSIGNYLLKVLNHEKNLENVYVNPNVLAEIVTNVRPTGSIVGLFDFDNSLEILGSLKNVEEKQFFFPRHKGYPVLEISNVNHDISSSCNAISCRISNWESKTTPIGKIMGYVNKDVSFKALSTLKNSVEELLRCFNIQDKPFSEEILRDIHLHSADASLDVTNDEMKYRKNFMDKFVFSIDPPDAKDLDDALHVELLPNGHLEVGVHIADVSHFVKPGTALDKEAMVRANSFYLVQKVIPMLPPILSENLCSLNANENKFTFSVIFTFDDNGEILTERFVKGIIKSRMRLNYDQADNIIAGITDSSLQYDHPNFEKVVSSIKTLHNVAQKFREKRLSNGALSLEKAQINFITDKSIKCDDNENMDNVFPKPTGFHMKVRKDSSILIEEWMLLANQAAARFLFNAAASHPSLRETIGAVLRHHPPPTLSQLKDLKRFSTAAGIRWSSFSGHEVNKILGSLQLNDPTRASCLSALVYTNMQLALYCCAESHITFTDPTEDFKVTNSVDFPFHHFGLHIPLYTHFTSPIRRYSDLLVHRQIDAIINRRETCGNSLSERLQAVFNCNANRVKSRRMQDRLNNIYLADYLKNNGWHLTKAFILSRISSQLTLLLPTTGTIYRCPVKAFVPWAASLSKVATSDKATIRISYLSDDSNYEIDLSNGFSRYIYDSKFRFPSNISTNEDDEDTNGDLDDKIDALKYRGIENVLPETGSTFTKLTDQLDEYSTFDIEFFEQSDCYVYCSQTKHDICVELPFPGSLNDYSTIKHM